MVKQSDRQTDMQTGTQADRQTDNQTDRQMFPKVQPCFLIVGDGNIRKNEFSSAVMGLASQQWILSCSNKEDKWTDKSSYRPQYIKQ